MFKIAFNFKITIWGWFIIIGSSLFVAIDVSLIWGIIFLILWFLIFIANTLDNYMTKQNEIKKYGYVEDYHDW